MDSYSEFTGNIIEETNHIARIGIWYYDLVEEKLHWNNIIKDIAEIPHDFEPTLQTAFGFYKEGINRDTIYASFIHTIKTGEPFDVDLEIETAKGNQRFVRSIGQAEHINGRCVKVYGIFQDITERTKNKILLDKKNKQLTFAEELSMIGYWNWDLVNDNLTMSDNLYLMYDLPLGKPLSVADAYSRVHKEDLNGVNKHLTKVLRTKKFEKYIHRVVKQDGTIRYLELIGKTVTDENGKVIELFGSCQDITEQRMAEIKFRGLMESAPDAMVITDERGRIQLINNQAELLFGYSLRELFKKPVTLLTPTSLRDLEVFYGKDFYKNPKNILFKSSHDLFITNKEGKYIPAQISVNPVATAEGTLISIAIRDITEQKRAEYKILETNQNLRHTTTKLKTQNKQLEDFTHITSHNLRSPVSNLNTLLGFYKEAEDDEERALIFEKFETVVDHLTSTLNTLIDSLTVKNNRGEVLETSMSQTFKKTKEMLGPNLQKTGTSITVDFSQLDTLRYNPIYLESIFLNLMSNGIKYRSPNRAAHIKIRTILEGSKAFLEFADNGLGIDLQRYGHKIFGLNKVFHRNPEARGVGLFMTKAQVEAMGGSIRVDSKVDVGTTFTIDLNYTLDDK
ncbi:sensor histidine kinase [Croceivirga sp. JEA036]|uniref:sensor histidine kinase n=1 Tax=Croceivirga sp. JEA036 TaxID=2721162 RepID=UPI00143ADB00|nr:HAMP domain-containing sensor histidine kinase [Croceivirga sp. JEA036]NJB37204.1 PAS domain S-box protein [Croceivirga sp. JEA036]